MSLGEMWRRREWHELYGLIMLLPAHSRFVEAQLNDPENVERMLDAYDPHEDEDEDHGPPWHSWSPVQSTLANIEDLTSVLIEMQKDSKSRKQPKPARRPTTLWHDVREMKKRDVARDDHKELLKDFGVET